MRDQLIVNAYEKTKAAVMKKLVQVTACSIMMDLWSSKSMQGYCGISCAAVTDDYQPFSCLLSINRLEGQHTARAILAEYEEIVEEWKISQKVVSIVIYLFYIYRFNLVTGCQNSHGQCCKHEKSIRVDTFY